MGTTARVAEAIRAVEAAKAAWRAARVARADWEVCDTAFEAYITTYNAAIKAGATLVALERRRRA